MACGTGTLATPAGHCVTAPCILVLASDFGCKPRPPVILRIITTAHRIHRVS